MRPKIALGSSTELSAFTMSLAPLVHSSPISLTEKSSEHKCFKFELVQVD